MKIEINIDIPTPPFTKFLPHVLLGVWLILIGVGIWQHAAKAVQPPVYDTLTYYQKAKNFWTTVYEGKLINPFNIAPTFRPPGTIVMSYPFGFSEDFHAFYFRSVFFPALCLVFAVYIAGYSRKMDNKDTWNLAVLAIFLSTLPMFYHFERSENIPSPAIWGLVDSFLAGVAALSTAALLRSVKTFSMRWLFAAVCLAGFCLLIKPSGSLVMGLTGGSWLLMMLVQLKFAGDTGKGSREIKRLIINGLIMIAVVYSCLLAASVFLGYLSKENISFGKAAIRIMQQEMKLTFPLLLKMMRISLGYVLPLFWLIIVVLSISYRDKIRLYGNSLGIPALSILLAIFYVAVGFWFWIFASGGVTQVRYFFPFPLMAIVVVIPVVFQVFAAVPSRLKFLLQLLLLVPAVNMMVMLWSPQPSPAWQKFSGVNLSTGLYRDEINQAKSLVDQLRKEGSSRALYSFYSDAATAAFESVGTFERVLHPSEPVFITRLPVDWQRPAVIRLDDMLTSEYVLFTPVRDPSAKAALLRLTSPKNFGEEQLLFQAIFSDLTEAEGVRTVSETKVRLLKIVNSRQLWTALEERLKKYSWRPVYVEANAGRWFGPGDLGEVLKQPATAVKKVAFDEKYKVHALSLVRDKKDIVIRVWWEQTKSGADKQWYMFFHLVDDKGNILYNQQVLLADRIPVDKDRFIQRDTITFRGVDNALARSLAFGIYSPASSSFLHADTGVRDWNNRRVIAPLPKNL